jgi:hypothetical protein
MVGSLFHYSYINNLDSVPEEETDCSGIINVYNSHLPHAQAS